MIDTSKYTKDDWMKALGTNFSIAEQIMSDSINGKFFEYKTNLPDLCETQDELEYTSAMIAVFSAITTYTQNQEVEIDTDIVNELVQIMRVNFSLCKWEKLGKVKNTGKSDEYGFPIWEILAPKFGGF